jgi:hypothetical protein
MTDTPPAAIEAAAVALHQLWCEHDDETPSAADECTGAEPVDLYRAARALEAAAPLIAAAEREACAQLAESEADRNTSLLSTYSGDDALRQFAALIRADTPPAAIGSVAGDGDEEGGPGADC